MLTWRGRWQPRERVAEPWGYVCVRVWKALILGWSEPCPTCRPLSQVTPSHSRRGRRGRERRVRAGGHPSSSARKSASLSARQHLRAHIRLGTDGRRAHQGDWHSSFPSAPSAPKHLTTSLKKSLPPWPPDWGQTLAFLRTEWDCPGLDGMFGASSLGALLKGNLLTHSTGLLHSRRGSTQLPS